MDPKHLMIALYCKIYAKRYCATRKHVLVRDCLQDDSVLPMLAWCVLCDTSSWLPKLAGNTEIAKLHTFAANKIDIFLCLLYTFLIVFFTCLLIFKTEEGCCVL